MRIYTSLVCEHVDAKMLSCHLLFKATRLPRFAVDLEHVLCEQARLLVCFELTWHGLGSSCYVAADVLTAYFVSNKDDHLVKSDRIGPCSLIFSADKHARTRAMLRRRGIRRLRFLGYVVTRFDKLLCLRSEVSGSLCVCGL